MASSTLFLVSYRPLKTQKNEQLDTLLASQLYRASPSFEFLGPSIPLLVSQTQIPISLGHDIKNIPWVPSVYKELVKHKTRLYLSSGNILPNPLIDIIKNFTSKTDHCLGFTRNDLLIDYDLCTLMNRRPLRGKSEDTTELLKNPLTLKKVSLDFDIISRDQSGEIIHFSSLHRFHVKNHEL